jgi:hypothetical protein
MAAKKEETKKEEKNDPEKSLDALHNKVNELIKHQKEHHAFLEKMFPGYNVDEGYIRLRVLLVLGLGSLLWTVSAAFAADGDQVVYPSPEGTVASIVLQADEGDDTDDTVRLRHGTDNTFDIEIGGDDVMTVTPAGNATFLGTLSSAASTKGTVGTQSGLTGVEYVLGNYHQVILTLTAMELETMDAAGTVAGGGTNVYTFPEGLICTLGAVIDGTMTGAGAAYMLTNWVGDVALGTTEFDDTASPMVTTQQDILKNTAVAAADQLVGILDAVSAPALYTESGASWIDGTAAAEDVWLNVLIDENAANEDNATNTITGTIEFSYIVLGDN